MSFSGSRWLQEVGENDTGATGNKTGRGEESACEDDKRDGVR